MNNDSNNELKLPNQLTFNRLKSLENDLANLTAEKVFTRDYFKATLTDQQGILEKQCSTCKDSCSKNTEKDNCCNKNITNDEEIQYKSNENLVERLLMEYKEKVYKLLDELGFDKNSF